MKKTRSLSPPLRKVGSDRKLVFTVKIRPGGFWLRLINVPLLKGNTSLKENIKKKKINKSCVGQIRVFAIKCNMKKIPLHDLYLY